jgi:CRP-like cAMP-binding protein
VVIGAKKLEARLAVVAAPIDAKNYVRKTVAKNHQVKKLIFDAIKHNILFRSCSDEELVDLVDAFSPKDYSSGSVVIKQFDEGNQFYVVESGTLDVSVRAPNSNIDIGVGVSYESGSAFGELALMYGSPRAATIRARSPCKLWYIERNDYRGITGQYKLKQMNFAVELVKNLKFGDKVLGQVMQPSEIDAMVLATQIRLFKKGDTIIREGERGDMLYIIDTGTVDVYKKSSGDKPVASLRSGQFFGEKALLSEDVRQATCVATSDLKCLMLMREDFNIMLGDLKDLLEGSSSSSFNSNVSDATGIFASNSSEAFKYVGEEN